MLRWMTPFLGSRFSQPEPLPPPRAPEPPSPPMAPQQQSRPTALPPPSQTLAQPERSEPRSPPPPSAPQPAPPANCRPACPAPITITWTTVAPGAAPLYVRRGRALVVEEEDPDVLFTPVGVVPYAPRVFGTPLLPGSSTLPGYYGTNHSYSYDGAYYGGPSYGPYWNRLPYACGVYGYC